MASPQLESAYLQPLHELEQSDLSSLAASLIALVNTPATQKELALRNLPTVIGQYTSEEHDVHRRLEDQHYLTEQGYAEHYAIRMSNGAWAGMAQVDRGLYLREPRMTITDNILTTLGITRWITTQPHKHDGPKIIAWTGHVDKKYNVLSDVYKSLCEASGMDSWTVEPVRAKRATEAIGSFMEPVGDPKYYDHTFGEKGIKSLLYNSPAHKTITS